MANASDPRPETTPSASRHDVLIDLNGRRRLDPHGCPQPIAPVAFKLEPDTGLVELAPVTKPRPGKPEPLLDHCLWPYPQRGCTVPCRSLSGHVRIVLGR